MIITNSVFICHNFQARFIDRLVLILQSIGPALVLSVSFLLSRCFDLPSSPHMTVVMIVLMMIIIIMW